MSAPALPRSIHTGPLGLVVAKVEAHVPDDGRRVIGMRSLVEAPVPGAEHGNLRRYFDGIPNKPSGLSLEPIAGAELRDMKEALAEFYSVSPNTRALIRRRAADGEIKPIPNLRTVRRFTKAGEYRWPVPEGSPEF